MNDKLSLALAHSTKVLHPNQKIKSRGYSMECNFGILYEVTWLRIQKLPLSCPSPWLWWNTERTICPISCFEFIFKLANQAQSAHNKRPLDIQAIIQSSIPPRLNLLVAQHGNSQRGRELLYSIPSRHSPSAQNGYRAKYLGCNRLQYFVDCTWCLPSLLRCSVFRKSSVRTIRWPIVPKILTWQRPLGWIIRAHLFASALFIHKLHNIWILYVVWF